MPSIASSMDWPSLEDALVRLGEALERPASLVAFGATVCMSLGLPERMTMDVDIWKKDSTFDLGDMKRACEKVGICFNPQGVEDPETIYIQMVEPGIVQLGKFKETETILRSGQLEVRRPPIENVIASKMVRGEARDYDDSAFLIRKCQIAWSRIETAIGSICDAQARETATENLTLLRCVLDMHQLEHSNAKSQRPRFN